MSDHALDAGGDDDRIPLTARYARLGARLVVQVDIAGAPCGALTAPSRESGERLLDMINEAADKVVYLGDLREPEPPL